MNEQELNARALDGCMQSGWRYLEVLMCYAEKYQEALDPAVYSDVKQSFIEYRSKMKEAGMEVKLDAYDF